MVAAAMYIATDRRCSQRRLQPQRLHASMLRSCSYKNIHTAEVLRRDLDQHFTITGKFDITAIKPLRKVMGAVHAKSVAHGLPFVEEVAGAWVRECQVLQDT